MHHPPTSWSRPVLLPYVVATQHVQSFHPALSSPRPAAVRPLAASSMPLVAPPPFAQQRPAIYVLASFALMLLLAAAMCVFGSVATLSLIDGMEDEPAAPLVDAPSPAASLD
jgi:hypothetical protein